MTAIAHKKINTITSSLGTEKKYHTNFIEQEFDRKIAQGQEDMKMGRFTMVNKETNAIFIEKMKKELLIS